jgi:hypothetical protein
MPARAEDDVLAGDGGQHRNKVDPGTPVGKGEEEERDHEGERDEIEGPGRRKVVAKPQQVARVVGRVVTVDAGVRGEPGVGELRNLLRRTKCRAARG